MKPIDRYCPACQAGPTSRCVSANGKPTTFHFARLTGKVETRNALRPRKG